MFEKKFDIITFGSSAQDIFLKSEGFKVLDDGKNFSTGRGICLPFGSKVNAEEIFITSGGGGTNTAVAFAKQGFKTAFCGAIGIDSAALEIILELKHYKVDIRFLVKKKEKRTNRSIIISSGGERTIIVYRGASDILCDKDISWKKIKHTNWFYLAPLAGEICKNFAKIADFAAQNKIKIAANPSKEQLSLPISELKNILQKINVLFLNQEEAAFLTKISPENEPEIFKKLAELCHGVIVVTNGGEGAAAFDGKYFYSGKPNGGRQVADTTGAGDAFASGFLSEYIRSNNIEKAMQLGMANSESNLAEIGAKTGLLSKGAEFTPIPVKKYES